MYVALQYLIITNIFHWRKNNYKLIVHKCQCERLRNQTHVRLHTFVAYHTHAEIKVR